MLILAQKRIFDQKICQNKPIQTLFQKNVIPKTGLLSTALYTLYRIVYTNSHNPIFAPV